MNMVTVLKFSFSFIGSVGSNWLKEWIETSLDGKILRWDLFKKESIESPASQLENKVINVEYQCRSASKERENAYYLRLIYMFSMESFDRRLIDGSHRPWLSIEDGKCFSCKRCDFQLLQAAELSFGTLRSSSKYLCHYRVVPDDFEKCEVEFCHDIRKLFIRCYILETEYELIIDYVDIKFIVSNYRNSYPSYTTVLFLYLSNTPLLYTNRSVGGNIARVRCLTLSAMEADVLGRSRVLCMKINSDNKEEGHSILSRLHARCSNMPINYVNVHVNDKVPYDTPTVDLEHYGSTYIFQGILRRSYFMLERLEDDANAFISKLKELARDDPDSLEKTLVALLEAVDDGKIFDVWKATLQLYSWYTSSEENHKSYFLVPPKTKLIRRIIITPTRQLFWPADIVSENRVLRNFSADHTIRITFRDDNYNRLPSTDCENSVYLETVKKPLMEGLVIGARKYEFLAWSNSQLREHSVWMYAKDDQKNTAITIRSWMGKFSSIKLVGKYMARMGQCFSHTEDTIFVPLEENSVQTKEDLMDGFDPTTGKEYCFSDGVGKISENLAKEVCDILGLEKTYSAFQIRYAGYKGMLTVDPTLKDLNIVFRKSMLKFECPQSTRLEIVKVSNSGPLQLNRPLITIMDQMGVPHTVFLKMQTEMLINMIEMFLDEDKASKYLSSYCSAPYLSFRGLCDAGVSLTVEPFFHSMLLAVHKKITWGIKSKAMIDIDPSEGRNMFGVLDETRTLKYGQVFVQYTTDIYSRNENGTSILQGKVLVTKNPCLQPGDVRLLEAVDVPDLHHIVDCIVFPQWGRRPHPDEMGGADLDGDEYTVIWKKELFFSNCKPRYFPAHETEMEALKLHRPVTVADMIAFFVNFIKNDQLGLIGTAHLVQADRRGLRHDICEAIAEKYSVAVDFPKTGLKKTLNDNEKPQEYPDFMQKKDKKTYKSSRALGKLFRACQFLVKQGDAEKYSYDNIEVDSDLVYPGWERYYNAAEQSKYNYIQHLKNLMQHYGVQHEAEVISGCFTQIHGRHREYQQYRREVEEILSKSVCAIWKSMRKDFLEEFIEVNSLNDMLDMSAVHSGLLSKASAWYMVTYNHKSAKYLSFPWIVADYLIKVKLENTNGCASCRPYGYSLSKLDSILQQENLISQLPELDTETVALLKKNTMAVEEAVVYTSLQLIIKWAYKLNMICKSNIDHAILNKIDMPSLVNIFIEAMHCNGFLCKPNYTPFKIRKKQEISPLLLCAYFFKFCISIRNCPENVICEQFPYVRCTYKALAKQCGPAFQRLVVSHSVKVFGLSIEEDYQLDEEEMEPILIDKAVFDKSILKNSPESFAVYNLQHWSGVKDIQMRKLNNCYIVTAAGLSPNILKLQQILNKDTQWLRNAFCTGMMPEKDQIKIQHSYE